MTVSDPKDPTVSVCIVTYQHALFIAQAVEGALMQKTTFPIEILVGEDESTDGTREICLELAKRFPLRVKVFLRQRRDVVLIDGKPRGSYNFRMTINEARGEFIALCEGDDFWTDPEKLQLQVDFLRANPDCVACCHDARLVDADGATIAESYFRPDRPKFDQRDVLNELLSKNPTCSMVFRRDAFEPLPTWYLRRPCDLYLDILLTGHGNLGFLDRNMAAYRKHAGGIWTGQPASAQLVELIVRLKLLLAEEFFLVRYQDLLLGKIEDLQKLLFTREELHSEQARIDQIVEEQKKYILTLERERDRLKKAGLASKTDSKRQLATNREQLKFIDELKGQVAERQSEIEGLRVQLDQLAATSREQTSYIARLEQLRDEATATASATSVENSRHLASLAEQQAFIAQLKQQTAARETDIETLRAQLNQLAATSCEQTSYIARLEHLRDKFTAAASAATAETNRHLAALTEQQTFIAQLKEQNAVQEADVAALRDQVNQLAATSREQTSYIARLEYLREELTATRSAATEETNRRLTALAEQQAFIAQLEAQATAHQSEVQALRVQLTQLATVSRDQAAYITSLQREGKRLEGEAAQAVSEMNRLGRLAEAQQRLIEQLQLQPARST